MKVTPRKPNQKEEAMKKRKNIRQQFLDALPKTFGPQDLCKCGRTIKH